jgi:hypothetical protein
MFKLKLQRKIKLIQERVKFPNSLTVLYILCQFLKKINAYISVTLLT